MSMNDSISNFLFPAGGAYSAPPDTLAGFKEATSKEEGRQGKGKVREEGKEGEGTPTFSNTLRGHCCFCIDF